MPETASDAGDGLVSDVFEIPMDGDFDEEGAERAPLAGFRLGGSRPPWLVMRSWNRELRLYRSLARRMHPEQPILTVAPPEGERKEDFPRTVEAWRDFCLERMRPLLGADPLLLGGWSFGGVLALEVGRRLEREGGSVALVTMLDTRLPKAHPEERKLARSVPHAIAHHATRLFEMAPEDRAPYLRERVAWQVYHARRRLGEGLAARRGRPPPIYRRPDGRTSEPRQLAEMTLLQKALWVAYLKYQPRPCTIAVAQFWCRESCEHVGDSSLGWARYLRGPLDSAPIAGDHLTLFEEPHARSLGPAVQARLDAAAA